MFKLESQNKNWNICHTMNETDNITMFVLVIPLQKYNCQSKYGHMWYAIKWPQTPALFRTLLWNLIFKTVGETNFQTIKNVCFLLPGAIKIKTQSWYSIYQNGMPGPIYSANFSRIGPVISKDRKYTYLDTWLKMMKQKLNYSQYIEQKQDVLRYVKNSELTREMGNKVLFWLKFSTSTSMLPMI